MGDKVTNLWKRASDEGENRAEIPWHLRYGSRTLGTFAGIGMYQNKGQMVYFLIIVTYSFQLIYSLVFGMDWDYFF